MKRYLHLLALLLLVACVTNQSVNETPILTEPVVSATSSPTTATSTLLPATDNIAAKDINHDIEVVVAPGRWSSEFGDVPTPELVGSGCQQLWFAIVRVAQLVSSFAHFGMHLQNPIHRANGTEIGSFVQQRGIDFIRRLVGKAFAVEQLMHFVTFFVTQCSGWLRANSFGWLHFGLAAAIECAAWHPKQFTGLVEGYTLCQFFNRCYQNQLLLFRLNVCSKACASFF